MAAFMVVAGSEVLVSAWAARAALVPVNKSGHPTLSVVMRGDNYGSSGWNKTWRVTWQIIRAALVASVVFLLTMMLRIGSVGDRSILLVEWLRRGPLLQQSSERNPAVHNCPLLLHGQAWTLAKFTPVRCMQHWKNVRHLDPVLGGPVFLGRHRRRRAVMVYSLDITVTGFLSSFNSKSIGFVLHAPKFP